MKTNSFDKKKDKKKPATGSTASHPHKSDEPNERSTGASVLTALRFRVYFLRSLRSLPSFAALCASKLAVYFPKSLLFHGS